MSETSMKPEPLPQTGGSFTRDPETGELMPIAPSEPDPVPAPATTIQE
ncbi:MAG: hypothetical protein PHY45_11690 [Rhodocyclaceae bacterium]|nr:hypothetical protein [Rhodocyclaceae bacterium]